jgi:uncharacterized protein YegP (UPF0339 family)
MKQTIKIFAVLCMTLVVVLLMASCDDPSKNSPPDNQTTPAETTPAATTPEETTPEETTPEETVEAHEHVWGEWTTLKEATCGVEGMKQRSCTTCPEVEYFSVVPTQNHLYNNECDTDCNACGATREVFNHQYGGDCDATCNVIGCGFVREAGEHQYDNACDTTCNVCLTVRVGGHNFVDGACTECGVALGVFENTSVYDNDGDGKNDVYLFTPIIPEKFTGEDAVHVWAGDHIPELSGFYVGVDSFSPILSWFCTSGYDDYFTCKVTVPEAGVYEMAIHTRLKDTRARGAKITINKDTANEYAFELSYQFATEEELSAAMENNYTRTSYMFGIQIELQAGDNYIRIDEPTQDLRAFYFRDFYFVKVADLTPHYHEFVDGKCECGFVPPVLENESTYDNDGDGKNDVYLFTAALPEKFTGEDAVHLWAGDHVPELSRLYTFVDSFFPIREWSCPTGSGDYYGYKVTVPETGIYEMAIHTHLKATKARGAKFTVNKDTENEYTFELSYQFTTEEASAAMENDYTRTSYMYGIKVELQAGDNYIRIEEPTQELKAFYFRNFYFVKVDDEIPHEHEMVDGKCECGFIPVFENASVYDNDGDGANDVYLFTPIIPEKFTGENVVSVWCMDYIPELSTSYVSDKNMFSTIYTMYCQKEFDEYFTYKVTVPEAGVYEMAIHTRLKDTRARGAKFTVNKDTANEYVFELSYQFATDEELFAAMENDYTRTSYMYSIRVELQAGDNYICVEGPTQDLRVFYFRDFYFVKVEE